MQNLHSALSPSALVCFVGVPICGQVGSTLAWLSVINIQAQIMHRYTYYDYHYDSGPVTLIDITSGTVNIFADV